MSSSNVVCSRHNIAKTFQLGLCENLELRPLNAKASFSGRSKKYINRLFQEITETLNGVN
jgi:hypothetical protein